MRIPFEQLKAEFKRILLKLDFPADKAELCATIFAENSRDGVYTHGLNRFPTFVRYVKQGIVKAASEPTLVNAFGAIEQWDGNLGPGIINARFCMDRAIKLAHENGIGCIAIRNTNHWMRGGTYGWQAADAGYIGINFTNTIANVAPWGGTTPTLGNNPLVIAVPREAGHVVLDMAISQFSFGKMHQYESYGEQLPVSGGYDKDGNLSTDPAEVLASKRVLPIGFWKGSGLTLVLDLLATVLSQGRSTKQITDQDTESGVSQVFIAIKPQSGRQTDELIEEILNFTKSSNRVDADKPISYPGENTLKTRNRNSVEGVLVDEKIWAEVKALEL
ncbi:3-dehydro-L-gulonate 2-dehydrogenase [Mucilaginibacter sp. UR6-11]|uniref:3-dehydro-L-gulonate 2-dehydrogenase n=1 Tax=Mucilaginibacter sp. UR6-11 TaxID=1435644 RepID=UPI001E625BB7|nr:3-dehydro-L-gulonate 2-dehydrogenase [Mucilaginibacter sp. UR6-11]MCC8424044.1 3-dehydro-L-gulonate 2-dehydrogenase [Mucilaginibacter sp. UR6-11]